MKFCQNCGAQSEDKSKFCISCGNSLNNGSSNDKKSNITLIIIFFALLIVAIILSALVFLQSNNRKAQTEDIPEEIVTDNVV